MIIQHAKRWLVGTALAATALYFASIATAETIADAFEPDLEAWEELN
jgi:hypothetical protein